MNFKVPILFLVFNRPDTTKQVFERIRQIQPAKLFIAADGARTHVEGESARCEEVKRFLDKNITWQCEVHKLYRAQNFGCGRAVSEAITWFFNHVEEGIILEDDCLPDISFFFFCEELLKKYSDDNRIGHIAGNNFQFGRRRGRADYYFSRYPHIWGWATWRRAWQSFKLEITEQDYDLMLQRYSNLFPIAWVDAVRQMKMDTWDVQWVITIFLTDKLSIIPNVNLVENIGFDNTGTHTKNGVPFYVSGNPVKKMRFPMKHASNVMLHEEADRFTASAVFKINRSVLDRLYFRLKKYIKSWLQASIITVVLVRL